MDDENPYKSPEAEPEKPPPKPPSKPPNRYVLAGLYGFLAFGGVTMLQALSVATYHWVRHARVLPLDEERRMLLIYALIASPVGVLIAGWTLRAPKSKWVFAVALLLGSSGFIVAFIGVIFLGLP